LKKLNVYGVLLTDLSRAFDCLPPKLLISKLHAYGVSPKSCMVIANYFTGRKQRVKLAHTKGNWLDISKGAPQGSLMGPFCYNIHSNDLLYLLIVLCDVFNYADDNTVACVGTNVNELQTKLENVSNIMLRWFDDNMMKANPEKFQFIVFNTNSKADDVYTIKINDITLSSTPIVKLLGIHIDAKLCFGYHISELCSKAGRKINVLSRLSSVLDYEHKLLLFNSFVVAQFNFCPIVWHYCNRSDMIKIEKVQYRALKYVHNKFMATYTELRQMSNKRLLYETRVNTILCEIHKCIYKTNPCYLHKLFELNVNCYNTRGILKLKQPSYRYVKFGKNKLSYHGVKLWNLLPDDLKDNCSISKFKKQLNSWTIKKCPCTYCDLCILYNI